MTHTIGWGMFIVSFSLLVVILLRSKMSVQWLAFVGLNIVLAAVLLYALNWIGVRYGVHMPLNATTITTVGILGIPGLMLLLALKGTLIGFG